MRFEVLGSLRVRHAGVGVLVRSGTQRKLLAALLTRAGGQLTMTELVDALWPQTPPTGAVKNVQSYVAKLKKTLGPAGPSVLTSGPSGYAVRLEPGDLDAHEFTENVRRAREAARVGDTATADVLLDRALRLWRGRPYSDLHEWQFLQPEIERLEQQRLDALDLGIELGRHDDLLPELTQLVDEDPYQERPIGLLMRALHTSGRQADAQHVYRRTQALLADQLGIDPTTELQELYLAMLRGDPDLTPRPPAINPTEPIAGTASTARTIGHEAESVVLVDGMPRPPKALQERAEELEGLRALVDENLRIGPGSGTGPTVVCSLTGARGVGKSQVAAAYARSRISQGWTVVWVDAESREQLVTGLSNLAETLGPGYTDDDTVRAARRACRWLSSLEAPGVLILDNANDPNLIRDWLPSAGPVQVVITSNRRVFGWLGAHVELGVFTVDQARNFLHECTGIPTGEAADSAAEQISEAVGGYPLALAVAAAVITRERLTYQEYLRRLAALPVEAALAGHEEDPYPGGIGDAIRLSLAAVEQTEPDARQLAELLAVLAAVGTARSLLIPDNVDEETKAARSRTLGLLLDTSLASYSHDGYAVIMHRLTSRVVREHAQRDGRLDNAVSYAIRLLANHMQAVSATPKHRQAVTEVVTHLQTLVEVADVAALPRPEATELLDLCAIAIEYLRQICDSVRVNPLNRALLTEQERILGTEHPATWRSRGNLALEYRQQGKVDDAITLFEQVLTGQRQLLGADHPHTLATRYNLGATHLTAGHPHRTIALLDQTAVDQERALGPEHPDTLITRKRLAWAHRSLGHIDIATQSYEDLIAGFERALGAEHPLTLRARSDFACVHRSAGRLDDAIQLLEHNLTTWEQALGTDYPDTRHDRDRLAGAYRAIGRHREAIQLFEQSLTEWEQILGDTHPWTLMARNNLACAYEAAGQTDAAIDLFEQTLTEHEHVLGPQRHRTLNVRNNLACAYHQAGRLSEAIALLEQTLADRENVLDSDHPDTNTSRHNLATAFQVAGRTQDAIQLLALADEASERQRDTVTLWQRNHNAYAAVHGVDETIRLS